MKQILTIIFIIFSGYMFAQDMEKVSVGAGQYAVRTLGTGVTYVDYYATARSIWYHDSISSITVVDTVFYIEKESGLDTVLNFTRPSGEKSAWLLESGGEWRDSLIVADDSTMIGRYGATGDAPILNGASLISNWVADTGFVYKAKLSFLMNHFIVDDTIAPISRWEESTWTDIDSVNVGNKEIFSSALAAKGVDWSTSNSYVAVKTVAWLAYHRPIASVVDSVLTYSGDAIYALTSDDVFYVENAKEAMTFPNSWYFDNSDSTLYWWPKNNDSPSNYITEASIINNGIYGTGRKNVIVKDIVVKNYIEDGIRFLENCEDIEVNGNILRNNYECGVQVYDAQGTFDTNNKNVNIIYNTVHGSSRAGIRVKGDTTLISDNTVSNMGLIEQFNWKGAIDASNAGVGILGYPVKNSVIKWNRLDNIGYNGIHFHADTTSTIVTENVVTNFCEDFTDGGGIYTHLGHDSTVISKNFTYHDTQKTGSIIGVYLDGRAVSVIAKENVSFFNKEGLHTNNIENVTIIDNILYNNNGGVVGSSQLSTKEFDKDGNAGVNLFSGNICFSDAATPDRSLYMVVYNIDSARITFENNIFGMPRTTDLFLYKIDAPQIFDSAADIAAMEGYLGQSNIGTRPTVSDYSNSQLFYNDTKYAESQDLSAGTWKDLDGNVVSSLTLQPFTSQILIMD